jgi:hypothetical protein
MDRRARRSFLSVTRQSRSADETLTSDGNRAVRQQSRRAVGQLGSLPTVRSSSSLRAPISPRHCEDAAGSGVRSARQHMQAPRAAPNATGSADARDAATPTARYQEVQTREIRHRDAGQTDRRSRDFEDPRFARSEGRDRSARTKRPGWTSGTCGTSRRPRRSNELWAGCLSMGPVREQHRERHQQCDQ